MTLRRLATVALLSTAVLAAAGVHGRMLQDRVAGAGDGVTVIAPRPPPPPMLEQVAPRPGYLWAHGYWRWNGRDFVAVPGHWEPVRPGYRYVNPHWEHRPDGWHWRVGVWLSG